MFGKLGNFFRFNSDKPACLFIYFSFTWGTSNFVITIFINPNSAFSSLFTLNLESLGFFFCHIISSFIFILSGPGGSSFFSSQSRSSCQAASASLFYSCACFVGWCIAYEILLVNKPSWEEYSALWEPFVSRISATCCRTRTHWHVCTQPNTLGWRKGILVVRSRGPKHLYYHRGPACGG